MKVGQSPVPPVPERKPEPPPAKPATAEDGAFAKAMAAAAPLPARKPEPPIRLANGQSAPPPPGRKPDASVAAAPLPARKPDAQTVESAPLPDRKPDAPDPLSTPAARIALASQQVAGLSGHSFVAILAQATQESGLDPNAKSRTSSAAGPFQILERTWLDLFRRHGSAYGLGGLAQQIEVRNGVPVVKDKETRKQILDLRHDVDIAAGMAARYLAEGRASLEKRLKRDVTEAESRLAYIMGVGGASALIRAAERTPNVSAAQLLPAAAKANHNLFHDRATGRALTAEETVARLIRRMEIDQREMFAAIGRAPEPRQLDGGPSPFNPFRAVTSPEAEDGPALG